MDYYKKQFNDNYAMEVIRLERELELIRNCYRRMIIAVRFENYDRVLSLCNEIIYRVVKLKEMKGGKNA